MSEKYKYNFRFFKKGLLIFISHLDLMRLFMRLFKKVDLPVVYSEGFNPHMRLSLPFPLGIGCSGLNEWGEIFLDQEINEKEAISSMNDLLPKDIQIIDFKKAHDNKSLTNRLESQEYKFIFKEDKRAELIGKLLDEGVVIKKIDKKGNEIEQQSADYLTENNVKDNVLTVVLKQYENKNIRYDNLLKGLSVDTDELEEIVRQRLILS